MEKAKNGDTVRVHYTGKLQDGTVFDSSTNRDPLQFTIGGGDVIPGFEKAVVGMSPGESKDQTISAEQAYGPHRDELMVKVDKKNLPADLNVGVGQHLKATDREGRVTNVMVAEVSESSVTLDANHPLAGKDLRFEIELVEVVPA
jgi:peptidylprolyl isomerase